MVTPSAATEADDLEDLLDHQRREAHGGLVEQQQAGPRQQRAADGDHLLLAAGQGAGHLLQALLDPRQHAEDALHVGLDGFVVAPAVGAHAQVLLDRQAGEDAAPFRHQGQALAQALVGRQLVDALAVVEQLAAGRAQGAGDGVEGGGLAGAVGPDQRHQLAGPVPG
jgi:hypothetical protein